MSVSNVKNGSHVQYGITDYVIDTTSEISSLPTGISMGSKAFCVEDNKYYILNGQKQWVEYKGGGGGSSEDIETVAENFAPAYDETQTYSVGDLVVYNYILYKCTTAVTTPEEFDSVKWEHTTLESSFEIDDGDTSAVKTWSSSKINTQIGSVATYVDAVDTKATNVTNTVNTLLSPQATKLHEWILDTTTPYSIDTIDGTSRIQADTIVATSDYWQINAGHGNICSMIGLLIPNKEIEIEFATCEPTFTVSQIRGLIGFAQGVNNAGELSYYSSLCWDATNNCFSNYDRNGFVKTLPNFNSIDGFSNGTMKFFVNSSNSVDVYVNNVLVGNFDPKGYQYLTFGIPLDRPYYTLRVKRITVYSGSNGEDILNRINDLEDEVSTVSVEATSAVNTLTNLLGPRAQKVYEWNFTDSLIDKIAGKEVTLSSSGSAQDNTGLTLNGGNASITNALTINRTYEIEFGNSELSYTSGYASLIGYKGRDYYGTTSSFGLYQGNWGFWNYYGNYQASGVNINYQNTSFLNGGKLTLTVNSNNSITVNINGALIGTFTLADFSITNSTLWLGNGSADFSMHSIKIKKLTVYAGTTNGEDILNRIEDLEDTTENIINDTTPSANSTYSSNKIEALINGATTYKYIKIATTANQGDGYNSSWGKIRFSNQLGESYIFDSANTTIEYSKPKKGVQGNILWGQNTDYVSWAANNLPYEIIITLPNNNKLDISQFNIFEFYANNFYFSSTGPKTFTITMANSSNFSDGTSILIENNAQFISTTPGDIAYSNKFYADPPQELPQPTIADAGKLLTVNSSGIIVWADLNGNNIQY